MGDLADADNGNGEAQVLVTRKPVWNEQVQSLVPRNGFHTFFPSDTEFFSLRSKTEVLFKWSLPNYKTLSGLLCVCWGCGCLAKKHRVDTAVKRRSFSLGCMNVEERIFAWMFFNLNRCSPCRCRQSFCLYCAVAVYDEGLLNRDRAV